MVVGKKSYVWKEHTEESKNKISEAAKERFKDPENHPMYGKHLSEEAKQKLSEAQKQYWTEEKRNEMSEKRKGKYTGENNPNFGNHKLAGAANPRAKKIIRLFDKKIYDYIGQAAEDNNVSRNVITSCCKKHKDFMFYDEYLLQLNILT